MDPHFLMLLVNFDQLTATNTRFAFNASSAVTAGLSPNLATKADEAVRATAIGDGNLQCRYGLTKWR